MQDTYEFPNAGPSDTNVKETWSDGPDIGNSTSIESSVTVRSSITEVRGAHYTVEFSVPVIGWAGKTCFNMINRAPLLSCSYLPTVPDLAAFMRLVVQLLASVPAGKLC